MVPMVSTYAGFAVTGARGYIMGFCVVKVVRTVRKNKQYDVCRRPGRCIVLKSSRNGCKFCRMQRCLDLGMSYEAVKMGRPKNNDKKALTITKTTSINETKDKLILNVYSAFMKAMQGIKSARQDADITESDWSYYIVTGMVNFSSIFAKEQYMFRKLSTETQILLLKSALLELAVFKDILEPTNNNSSKCQNLEVMKADQKCDKVIEALHDTGSKVKHKLDGIKLTFVEIGLFLGLILFCSDRVSNDCKDFNVVMQTEHALLLALKYQIVMNHNRHIEILPHISMCHVECNFTDIVEQRDTADLDKHNRHVKILPYVIEIGK
ncbi:E75BC-like protein [Mya arenaria]|uniref:E75BC-like protein n=1 Tax=Mya arenaria TaxID=6604 RepID=A0ABY7DHC0_MYAAR|nr:E75BC-like protein [Mya arenaria]